MAQLKHLPWWVFQGWLNSSIFLGECFKDGSTQASSLVSVSRMAQLNHLPWWVFQGWLNSTIFLGECFKDGSTQASSLVSVSRMAQLNHLPWWVFQGWLNSTIFLGECFKDGSTQPSSLVSVSTHVHTGDVCHICAANPVTGVDVRNCNLSLGLFCSWPARDKPKKKKKLELGCGKTTNLSLRPSVTDSDSSAHEMVNDDISLYRIYRYDGRRLPMGHPGWHSWPAYCPIVVTDNERPWRPRVKLRWNLLAVPAPQNSQRHWVRACMLTWWWCMYICMYVCMYVCIVCMCVCVGVCACVRACVRACVHACMHACMYVGMYKLCLLTVKTLLQSNLPQGRLEKVMSNLEKVMSNLEKVMSNLEKVMSTLEKVMSSPGYVGNHSYYPGMAQLHNCVATAPDRHFELWMWRRCLCNFFTNRNVSKFAVLLQILFIATSNVK